jgi:hypothetical protein
MNVISNVTKAGIGAIKYLVGFFGLLLLALLVNNVINVESTPWFFFFFRCLSLGMILLFVPMYFTWKNKKLGIKITDNKKRAIRNICYQLSALFVVFELLIAWRA